VEKKNEKLLRLKLYLNGEYPHTKKVFDIIQQIFISLNRRGYLVLLIYFWKNLDELNSYTIKLLADIA